MKVGFRNGMSRKIWGLEDHLEMPTAGMVGQDTIAGLLVGVIAVAATTGRIDCHLPIRVLADRRDRPGENGSDGQLADECSLGVGQDTCAAGCNLEVADIL